MRSRTGYFELVLCGLIWGSNGVLVKNVDVGAATIVWFRLALGALVVAGWTATRGRAGELRITRHRGLVASAGLVLAAHWVTFFEAYKRLSVATTILIVYVGPVLIALGAPLVLKERLERRTVAALGLSLAGIALIAVPASAGDDASGLGFAAFAAVSFAAVVLMLKRAVEELPPPAVAAWQLGIAAVVLSPVLASASGGELLRAAPTLVALGILHTGVAGLLYARALKVVRAQHASILAYLEPVTAVVWGWAILAEEPATATIIGGLLIIIAGLWIVVPGMRGRADAHRRRAPATVGGDAG